MTLADPQAGLVLLVEDNATDAKLARVILEDRGFVVVTVESAEDAWEAVDQRIPDVILSDMVLPNRNGVDLRRELLSDARTAHIPVIAMTAHPEAFPRALVVAERFAAYLPKPIDTRRLAHEVALTLER